MEIVTSQYIFFASLLSLAIGAGGSLLFQKSDRLANLWGNFFAIIASIFGLISSYFVLIFNSTFSFKIASAVPLLDFSFDVDKLSAFFIFVISLISLLASIYGIGYVKHYYGKYNIGTLGFFYNFFIAGMIMVASASNAIFFLVVWEIMSLASYFLVVYENKEKSNIKAGLLYFIMTHVGTAFIILSFLLLYGAVGSFDFSVIKNNIGAVSPILRNVIFVLTLIGFGTKAGIIPLHIWLPSAHPAAPTHVSALMSGVMIKTGIYMLMRIYIDIMPGTEIWWGMVILTLGAISSLLGVLYALTEHDIKKLLAYHSIENIGIILLGFGSSLVFLAMGIESLAILGLVASLFHTLNHAVFKALLFFGAGSVISKTHTRNIEEHGGLIKYMPQTAFFFLVGSMAISALPPFNGFFSEWMTFQSLFSGIKYFDSSVKLAFILGAGSLAFTGGLAAACFVKAFGSIFLARPRSEEAKHATESAFSLRFGMGALAFLSLVIGVFAGPVSAVILRVVGSLDVFSLSEASFFANQSLVGTKDGFANVSMPAVFICLVSAMVIVYFVIYILTKERKIKIGRTWDCGTDLNSRMEITATGFSRSIVTIFQGILKPSKQAEIEYHDADMRYFPKGSVVRFEIKDVYSAYFYKPMTEWISKISEFAKRIQSGNVNAYLLYIFLILIFLLLILVI